MIGRILIIASLICLSSCTQLYFDSLEKVGYTKRELLHSRTQQAYQSALRASEQLRNASFILGENQQLNSAKAPLQLKVIQRAISSGKDQADDTLSSIESAEVAAGALFDQWKSELGDYSAKSASRRSLSEQNLFEAENKIRGTLADLRQIHKNLESLITELEDKSLFLKHASIARELGNAPKTVDDSDRMISSLESLDRSLSSIKQRIASQQTAGLKS